MAPRSSASRYASEVNPEIGRFLEGHHLDTIKLLKVLYDIGTGMGPDAVAYVEGRELVVTRGKKGRGRGFIRVIPSGASVILAFPDPDRLFDPQNRLKGPSRSQRTVTFGYPAEIDPYIRRLIEFAYHMY